MRNHWWTLTVLLRGYENIWILSLSFSHYFDSVRLGVSCWQFRVRVFSFRYRGECSSNTAIGVIGIGWQGLQGADLKCDNQYLQACYNGMLGRDLRVLHLGRSSGVDRHLVPPFSVLCGLFDIVGCVTTAGLTSGLYRSGPCYFIIFVGLRSLNNSIGTVIWRFGEPCGFVALRNENSLESYRFDFLQ